MRPTVAALAAALLASGCSEYGINVFDDSVSPPDGTEDAESDGDAGSDAWSADAGTLETPGHPYDESAPRAPHAGTLDDPSGDEPLDTRTEPTPGSLLDDGDSRAPGIGTLDDPYEDPSSDEPLDTRTEPVPGEFVVDSGARAPGIGTLDDSDEDPWSDDPEDTRTELTPGALVVEDGVRAPGIGTLDDPNGESMDPKVDPTPGEIFVDSLARAPGIGTLGGDSDDSGHTDDTDDPDWEDPEGSDGEDPGTGDGGDGGDGGDDLWDEGCRTQGFWKNHPDVWPEDENGDQGLVLGYEYYTQEEALYLLHMESEGDASLIMAHQLIAAKLNVAWGWSNPEIEDTIYWADEWLEYYIEADADGDWLLPYEVPPSSDLGAEAILLGLDLDQFNNAGEDCGWVESSLKVTVRRDGSPRVRIAPFHRLGCATVPGPAPWALWVLLPLVIWRRRRE